MKKFFLGIIGSIKNLAMPNRSFPDLIKESSIILLIWTISVQVITSLIILFFLSSISTEVNPGTLDLLTNVMYGMVIAFPLFIFCMTVAFHHYARSLGGKGTFLIHYKMMMWSFLYMLGASMVLAIVINAFCSIFGIAIPESSPAFVYGSTFFIYSVFAMATTHEFSVKRAMVAHLIMIALAFGGYHIFKLLS